MGRFRYSVNPNAGKGLSGFVTNFNIAGEFDPAWLDSNPDFWGADYDFLTQYGCAQPIADLYWDTSRIEHIERYLHVEFHMSLGMVVRGKISSKSKPGNNNTQWVLD